MKKFALDTTCACNSYNFIFLLPEFHSHSTFFHIFTLVFSYFHCHNSIFSFHSVAGMTAGMTGMVGVLTPTPPGTPSLNDGVSDENFIRIQWAESVSQFSPVSYLLNITLAPLNGSVTTMNNIIVS